MQSVSPYQKPSSSQKRKHGRVHYLTASCAQCATEQQWRQWLTQMAGKQTSVQSSVQVGGAAELGKYAVCREDGNLLKAIVANTKSYSCQPVLKRMLSCHTANTRQTITIQIWQQVNAIAGRQEILMSTLMHRKHDTIPKTILRTTVEGGRRLVAEENRVKSWRNKIEKSLLCMSCQTIWKHHGGVC